MGKPPSVPFVAMGVLAALLPIAGCAPQRKPLTWDVLFGPQRVNFNGSVERGMTWLPADDPRAADRPGFLHRRDGVLQVVDALSDTAAPAYDVADLEAALSAQPDFDADSARRLARDPTLLTVGHTRALIEHEQRLYVYDFGADELRKLTGDPAERRELTLSPDGTAVAYVREHDLHVLDLVVPEAAEVRLTTGGSELLLNGELDWVYQEEIYGRGNWRGFWWSRDGRWLAYLQLDEREVPTYPLVDFRETHPPVEPLRYPKAGDPNPRVRLGIVARGGGPTTWIEPLPCSGVEILIVGVEWAPDGRLVYAVQDREGRWLELCDADPATGAARRLLREDSPAWVDYHGPPRWLADGTFLWQSERDGWRHLYHYARDGTLLRRITSGPWEVRELHGVDEGQDLVYFSGTRDGPLEVHAYRVPLAGGEPQRLTEPGCTHDVEFDPRCELFLDTFSSLTRPPRVQLCHADGTRARWISTNEVAALEQYALSRPCVCRIPTSRGYVLNAVAYPPGKRGNVGTWERGNGLAGAPFPPSDLPRFPRRSPPPVMVFVYGGPHASSVANRWEAGEFALKQWLAAQGWLVWTIDPHSASGEGAVSAWRCYRQLGATELEDIEDSLRWLQRTARVDLDRVAIYGHSYGGFIVAYALTHSRLFAAGIAAAAVTDWRNYDSIYTERFMQTPAHNPDGYARSSTVAAAADLHGRLLVVHGLRDDNVHWSNAVQLMDALQQAGRPFELMLYPADGHGLHGYRDHWRRLRDEFLEAARRTVAPGGRHGSEPRP